MDRALPTILIALVVLGVFLLMVLGWRALKRRQSDLPAPAPAPETLSSPSLLLTGLYVATTRAGEPLERIAAHGLGFRATATVGVHAEGLVLAVRGRQPILIAPGELRGAGRATWTIDRVVERDGLVMVGWMLGSTAVDSYLRLREPRQASALVRAIEAIARAASEDTPADAPEGIAS